MRAYYQPASCASPASGVLDTLVMGTTDAAAPSIRPNYQGIQGPLDVQDQAGGEECKNNSVASLSEQVCLGPKDFLNDWLEWEESDNDSETIDDRDIKERSLKDYDFISLSC